MEKKRGENAVFLTPLLLMISIVIFSSAAATVVALKEYSRHDFPPGFVFGSGTSAYQVEGAADEDGRAPSIIDTFVHDEIWHGGNGDVACDQYHKYKEDVQLMVDTGLDAYRFSISWPRLIPNGRGPVNPKGLQYYNNLINELIKHRIEPHVTLFHLDLPQVLQDEYGGFISYRIVKDFTNYAQVCFREFGDRVLHWTTMNEGNIFVISGYDFGVQPPQRCSPPFGVYCRGGNSTTEPYLATHNLLLAHASVVKLYRTRYQAKQNGTIGINLLANFGVPATNATEDLAAALRYNDFFLGWYMNPLVYGDYPAAMKKNAGSRIPTFTRLESSLVKGSFDFIGVNHYLSAYVKDFSSVLQSDIRDYFLDMAILPELDADDIKDVNPGEIPYMPWGMKLMLEYFKDGYGNPPIYIHENGQRTYRNSSLNDNSRVKYFQGFIGTTLDAMRNGSDIRGYFTWSLMDVFEILDGYISGYGLYFVDLDDPNLTRVPKLSQSWYSGFLKGQTVYLEEPVQEGTSSAAAQPHSYSRVVVFFILTKIHPTRRIQNIT